MKTESGLGTLWVQQILDELNLMKSASNDTQGKSEKNKKKRFDRKEQMSLSSSKMHYLFYMAGDFLNRLSYLNFIKIYNVQAKDNRRTPTQKDDTIT